MKYWKLENGSKIKFGGKTDHFIGRPKVKDTVFVLYGGQSVDGSGSGYYMGWTMDEQKAMRHYLSISGNPYSVGKVVVLEPDKEYVVSPENIPWT